MAEQKHVSGMHVGPLLSEDEADAIVETRERRKSIARDASQPSGGQSSQPSGDQPSTSKPKG
jgi:hypothetical protein